MLPGPHQPRDDAPARGDRARRAGYAAAAVLVARWLVPRVFPYVDPDALLQRVLDGPLLGSSALGEWAVAIAYLLPYVALGVAVYFRTARAAATTCAATGEPATKAEPRPTTHRLSGCVAAAGIAGFVWLAYANRFVTDDAYISFRYARNLVEGAGLVYHTGQRVEGYTNFLWVMLMSGGMRLGADPVSCAHVLGLACFAGTLAMTYQLGRLVLPSTRWALVAVVLVGTQFSVLSFATGGLETSLQTFLLVLGCLLVFSAHLHREWRASYLVGLSLVVAAGLLTRMDFSVLGSVLVTAAIASMLAVEWGGNRWRARALTLKLGLLLLPAALLVGAWLLWKWHYYGAILPNTYYAKRPAPGAMCAGFAYLWDFCTSYRYQLPMAVFVIGAWQLVRERHILATGIGAVVLWCAYLVWMGGGFMEFRFLVPIVPLLLLCILWTVTRFSWARRLCLPALAAVWVAYGSLAHAGSYGWAQERAEPVDHLRWQTEDALWAEAGKELHRHFHRDDVVIATTAAGILPYYARLPTIDMHGLTDATIARRGRIVSRRTGHARFADVAYLKHRRVNLVIGHPKIEPADALSDLPPAKLASCVQAADPSEDEALIVAIPITQRHVLLAWYLTPHPAIDRAIKTLGWHTFVVPPTAVKCGTGFPVCHNPDRLASLDFPRCSQADRRPAPGSTIGRAAVGRRPGSRRACAPARGAGACEWPWPPPGERARALP